MKNILQKIEKFKDLNKVVISDETTELTYSQLITNAQKIGSALLDVSKRNTPIAVMLPKSTACLYSFLGVVYSGHFYVVIDDQMPLERIEKIFSGLNPVALITNKDYQEKAESLNVPVYYLEDIFDTEINEVGLQQIRNLSIDTDPLYALYTSGSTGMPKGALLTHRNVLNYIDWVIETFDINENTVFGSQTPF